MRCLKYTFFLKLFCLVYFFQSALTDSSFASSLNIEEFNNITSKCTDFPKLPIHTKIFKNIEAGMVKPASENEKNDCTHLTLLTNADIEGIKVEKTCNLHFWTDKNLFGLDSISCENGKTIEVEGKLFKNRLSLYADGGIRSGTLSEPATLHKINFPADTQIEFIPSDSKNKKLGEPLSAFVDEKSKESIILTDKEYKKIYTDSDTKWNPHESSVDQSRSFLNVPCKYIRNLTPHTLIYKNLEARTVTTLDEKNKSNCPGIRLISDAKIDVMKIPKNCEFTFWVLSEESDLQYITCPKNLNLEIENLKFTTVELGPAGQIGSGVLSEKTVLNGITLPAGAKLSFGKVQPDHKRIGELEWASIDEKSPERIQFNNKKMTSITCNVLKGPAGAQETKWSPHETTKAEAKKYLEESEHSND